MATVKPMIPDGKKLSFAKVAASGSRDPLAGRPNSSMPPAANPRPSQEHHVPRPVIPLAPVPAAVSAALAGRAPPSTQNPPTSHPSQALTQPQIMTPKMSISRPPVDAVTAVVTNEMKRMRLEQKTPNLVVNGTSPTAVDRTGRGILSRKESSTSPEEKTDSNSDLGTKPPSLDGKSIASATTFALDEKESLRPDDSASMKAAAEDDDTFSNRDSILAGSRSDNRGIRIQIGEVTLNTSRPIPAAIHECRTRPEVQASPDPQPAQSGDGTTNTINNALYGQNPDEKLLEAMNSAKDRLFLLRLEKDVIDFVQNSKEPFIDLPPCNSFCRMLTHKLADYYHMTHSYEASGQGAGSVRIFRTPFCRVPPSLASIAAASAPKNDTPPPAILPKKIMRRGEEGAGSTAPPSADASKTASEVDSDGKEKQTARDRPTREEREEAYNRARERIFGTNEKAGESTPEGEDSNGVSRASSVSTKDKGLMKRKPRRRDDNEGFETRSQYAVYYGHPHQPWQPQYVPINALGPGVQQQPPYNQQMQPQIPQQQMQPQGPQQFASPMGPGYMSSPQQSQQYPQPQMSNNVGYQYPVASYGPPMAQPMQHSFSQPINMGRPQPAGPPMQAPYSQTGMGMSSASMAGSPMASVPVPTTPQQNWQQPFSGGNSGPGSGSGGSSYGTFRQNHGPPPQSVSSTGPSSSVPYPYGQLPANPNPNDPKSQHPIPGSYNRQHTFNPKTQSFVPGGNTMMPMTPPQGLVQGGPHMPHGSPQMAPVPVFNSMYGSGPQPQGPPSQPQQFFTGSAGIGMARQPSGTGMPPPPFQSQGPPPMVTGTPHGVPPHAMGHVPTKPQGPQTVNHAPPPFSHLPNYGNPASLPQKPPNPQQRTGV